MSTGVEIRKVRGTEHLGVSSQTDVQSDFLMRWRGKVNTQLYHLSFYHHVGRVGPMQRFTW